VASKGATKGHHNETVFRPRQRCTDAIEITRYLCNGAFHKISGLCSIGQNRVSPTAGFRPEFVGGRSYIFANRSTRGVGVAIPPRIRLR
jgi:hypothetical protein